MRQRFALTSVAWILALTTYWLSLGGSLAPESATAMLSALLVLYPAAEIWLYLKKRNGTVVSPVVVCSLLQFLVPFGIANMLYLLPEGDQRRAGLYFTGAEWLNRALILAFAACFAMWAGFEASLARRAGSDIRRWLLASHLLRMTATINWPAVVACMVISTIVRLYAISQGVYGYSSEAGQLIDLANQTQLIRLGTQLGTAALLALGIAYYQAESPRALLLVVLLALNEVAWGLLSGFKAQVVTPLVALAICKWLVTRRSPRMLLSLSLVAIGIAYVIIEPLRVIRQTSLNFDTRDLGSLVDAVVSIARDAKEATSADVKSVPIYLSVATRVNLTSVAGRAIEYSDNVGLGQDDPQFLKNILMAPAYALLPRALWPEKPTSMTAQWFGATVVGTTRGTGIGMSPVGYLYFAGGAIAVVIGFCVIGALQRIVQEAFQVAHVGAAVAFVGMLGVVGMIDSEFYSVIIEFIRYFPMMILIQLMLFRGPGRSVPAFMRSREGPLHSVP